MIPKSKITVLLAEDHAIVRQGLRTLLENEGCFKVIGQAQTGREAVEMSVLLSPDVIVMDIAMPELNGHEATRQIIAAKPSARVLILSAHSDDEYIDHMTAVGAAGFLAKQSSAEILAQAVTAVAAGKSFFSPAIARRMAASLLQSTSRDGRPKAGVNKLTSRETEVLQLVAEGHANKQVADTLKISIKTVEKHRQRVMDKLNIHETAGLTRYAISHRIIESDVQVTVF